MERDDVKSQITTMTICSGRNENQSLFTQYHNHYVLPAQFYVSYPDVSLSMTRSLSKDVFERRVSTGSGLFGFLNSCYA